VYRISEILSQYIDCYYGLYEYFDLPNFRETVD